MIENLVFIAFIYLLAGYMVAFWVGMSIREDPSAKIIIGVGLLWPLFVAKKIILAIRKTKTAPMKFVGIFTYTVGLLRRF